MFIHLYIVFLAFVIESMIIIPRICYPHLASLALGYLQNGSHAFASLIDIEEVNGIVLQYLLLLELPQIRIENLKCVLAA